MSKMSDIFADILFKEFFSFGFNFIQVDLQQRGMGGVVLDSIRTEGGGRGVGVTISWTWRKHGICSKMYVTKKLDIS